MTPPRQSRRSFLKTAAGVGLATAMPARSYARIRGASERLGVGIIGVGQMARDHLRTLLTQSDVEVRALCDVYRPNLEYGLARAVGAAGFADYRQLLDRPDLDAVVVATPDHWHALNTVDACKAGKDVYVEKPVAVRVGEGRTMVEAARRYDRIVQVGTQQRSEAHFQQAAHLVATGAIGDVSFVRTWNYGNAAPDGVGAPPDTDPPPGLDWDMWLGPAPWHPFNINRFGIIQDARGNYLRWASFRGFWDYAGGMMTDWGVHLLDIVQMAMGEAAPEFVAAAGGRYVLRDNQETPDTLVASFRYPDFTCIYETREANRYVGRSYGITFHGSMGTLFVDRERFELVPEGGDGTPSLTGEATEGAHARHLRNFLDCVKSRETPACDIAIGHRSSTTAMLGNIAYRTANGLHWDSAAERIANDPMAERLLEPQYRPPWKLEI